MKHAPRTTPVPTARVTAGDLEDIGAPAQVRAHHHHFAVMQAALATTRVALEEESLPFMRLLQRVEKRLRGLQVGSFKALAEAIVS